MSQDYSETMVMCLSVTYTPCATSLGGLSSDINKFTQFEAENLLSGMRNNAESCDESDDN